MTVTSHGSMSVGTEEAPGYYPCVRMRRSLDRRTCNVYARNLVAWRSARRRISSADRNTSFNSGISSFGAKNTYTGIPAAKSATDTAICSGSTRTMRRTQNAAPNSGTTILPRSSEAILGCRFANRVAERHVARYATARRNTDALINAANPPTRLARYAAEQRTVSPTYGVRNLPCRRLNAFGRNPSKDIAYASRDVPMVPDSSAPVIDSSTPTPTTPIATAIRNEAGAPDDEGCGADQPRADHRGHVYVRADDPPDDEVRTSRVFSRRVVSPVRTPRQPALAFTRARGRPGRSRFSSAPPSPSDRGGCLPCVVSRCGHSSSTNEHRCGPVPGPSGYP